MGGVLETMDALADGSVHLWQTDVRAAADRDLLGSYERLLSREESARHRRFLRERDRDLFLVAHALVRTTLSRYCSVSPSAWEFEMGERGRPEISGPVDAGLRFNLSHTPGRAVCAVARGRAIGVDVERLSRVTQPLLIADRFFAPAERAALRALPESQQHQRFFELWTLKESYIKARGLGLAIPLAQFWFAEPEREPIEISFAPELHDDPRPWQFRMVERGREYAMAVAVRQAAPISCRSRTTIPLLNQRR